MVDFIEYFFQNFFYLLSEQEICGLKGAFVFELNDNTNILNDNTNILNDNTKILLEELENKSKSLKRSMTHTKFLCSSDEKKLKEKPVYYNFICHLEDKFCYMFEVKNIKFYTFTDKSKKRYVYVKLESSETYSLYHFGQFINKTVLKLANRLHLKPSTSLKKCKESYYPSIKTDSRGNDTDVTDDDITDDDSTDDDSTSDITDADGGGADDSRDDNVSLFTDSYIKYYAEDIPFNKEQHIKIADITKIPIEEYIEKKTGYTICGNRELGNEIFINEKYLQKIVEKYKEYKKKNIPSGGKNNNYSKKIIKNTKKSSRPRTSSATRRRGRGRKKHRARSIPSKNRRP